MLDGAGPHTAKETIQALGYMFGELNADGTIISKGLWPLRCPDLKPLILFVGKTKKCCVCQQSA
jgi:hypothetical protein